MQIIHINEGFVRSSDDRLLRGASVAVCPSRNFEGYGDILLCVDALEVRGQNLTTTLLRSRDGGKTFTLQTVFEQRFV